MGFGSGMPDCWRCALAAPATVTATTPPAATTPKTTAGTASI